MANELRIERSVFDLDTMDEVSLVKVFQFDEVGNPNEALARVGNDSAKFLKIINDGLRAEAKRNAVSDPTIPWKSETEDGKVEDFKGTPADSKKVNALVLTLAKTIFGFGKDMNREQKRTAKDSAMEMIKSNTAIKEGLKKNAAADSEE